jgi:Na+-translocating ferredoxin:NAD+ oxidoreductase RnfD subunit
MGHLCIRLCMILTVASLVFMLFGSAYGLGALFFAASVETADAVSSYSTRGKIVDGAAALALWAILLGALTGHYFVGAQIVLGYAALSVLADALSSRAYRARYHAF